MEQPENRLCPNHVQLLRESAGANRSYPLFGARHKCDKNVRSGFTHEIICVSYRNMFQDAFAKLDPANYESLVTAVNDKLENGGFDPETAVILGRDLSFYPGYKIVELADLSVTPARIVYALHKNDSPRDTVLMDWTNAPVYELNARLPIALNDKNVTDYVRFFFHFVRGRHGRFHIVESVDDVNWQEEPPPAARKAIGKMISPVVFEGRKDDGNWQMTACMTFKDGLFKARIAVEPAGLVHISDEELLIEDMPVLDDTLAQ